MHIAYLWGCYANGQSTAEVYATIMITTIIHVLERYVCTIQKDRCLPSMLTIHTMSNLVNGHKVHIITVSFSLNERMLCIH